MIYFVLEYKKGKVTVVARLHKLLVIVIYIDRGEYCDLFCSGFAPINNFTIVSVGEARWFGCVFGIVSYRCLLIDMASSAEVVVAAMENQKNDPTRNMCRRGHRMFVQKLTFPLGIF
jgi:hypothetical protein